MTIEGLLKNARIIERHNNSGTIVVGSKVTVQEDGYEAETFHIVGSAEVNPQEGRISNKSPLGQALLGKQVGESVEVNTPGGVATFSILEID
jgi:transcription elongation factor GreA